jgi:hypothetical protein
MCVYVFPVVHSCVPTPLDRTSELLNDTKYDPVPDTVTFDKLLCRYLFLDERNILYEYIIKCIPVNNNN